MDSQTRGDATKHRVLVIDDDPDALYLLQEGLGTSEFEVIGTRTGYDGLHVARDQQPEAGALKPAFRQLSAFLSRLISAAMRVSPG